MFLGSISSRETTPWGPAVVEAYRVESQIPQFPRIALSKPAHQFVTGKMADKEKNGLIIRGEDGVWSLAPFRWVLRTGNSSAHFLTQERCMAIVQQLKAAHANAIDNPRVYQKIAWLCEDWDS